MSHPIALSLDGVTKKFALTLRGRRRLALSAMWQSIIGHATPDDLGPEEFWALRDISFSMQEGESIAILGSNGAGKSTLLNIIAGNLQPDRGSVYINGGIANLAGLNVGFEEEQSGSDNVRIKAALMGWSRKKTMQRLEAIADFADLGRFFEAPVRTYSSGMRMRLAFAIASHAEGSIYLLDEVLAVGDYTFRMKCLRRLNELRLHSSFILVSHNMLDVIRFCDRGIVLDKSHLVFDGNAADAVDYHQKIQDCIASDQMSQHRKSHLGIELWDRERLPEAKTWWEVSGVPTSIVRPRQNLVKVIRFRVNHPLNRPAISVILWNEDGQMLTALATDADGFTINPQPECDYELRLTLPDFPINNGIVDAVVLLHEGSEVLYREICNPLTILASSPFRWGFFTPNHFWTIQEAGST